MSPNPHNDRLRDARLLVAGRAYTNQQSLRWGYELLRDGFGIQPQRLHVTVLGGDTNLGPDHESKQIWQELGVLIEFLGQDNWWPNTTTPGPCGPDSELFYWTGDGPPTGAPSGDPHWVETWNHVNMRYRRHDNGTLTPLPTSNVDAGIGLERMVCVLQGHDSVYGTDLLRPWMNTIGKLWGLPQTTLRIVCDHLRSSIVVIGDGVRPSNTGRGYALRRLIRRSLTRLWTGDPSRTLHDPCHQNRSSTPSTTPSYPKAHKTSCVMRNDDSVSS